MKNYLLLLIGLGLIALPHFAQAAVVDELIADYQSASGEILDAKSGETLWKKEHEQTSGGQSRSCTTCHGDNLRGIGNAYQNKKEDQSDGPLGQCETLYKNKVY